MVTTFAVYLGYNMAVAPINLYHMMNNVAPDVDLIIEDENALYEIERLPGVEAAWWIETANMTVEGRKTYVTFTRKS